MNDVLSALLHLQETFAFQDRYILVGHSCGATLALQVAMRRNWNVSHTPTSRREVVPPVAVLAVEGLYDLPALVKCHSGEPVYKNFVTNAFGSDESIWQAVGPVSYTHLTLPTKRIV